ncbi:MAG: hypothetical protein LGB00_03595, partial [Sulfurovum sp.]|nr:hypothetical protein [Sulfurovum sp.]
LDFLSEKTFNEATDKENFTHAKLVSEYRSLRTNLPYLFTYKKYKHLGMHNTTNSLDDGYSQIAIADFLEISRSLVSKVLREEV